MAATSASSRSLAEVRQAGIGRHRKTEAWSVHRALPASDPQTNKVFGYRIIKMISQRASGTA